MSRRIHSIVCLHGFLGSAADWGPIMSASAWQETEITAIDLPTAPDWQSGVDAILAQIAEESVLVGYSMGARIALGCALRENARLTGLVLISGSPGIVEGERLPRAQQDQEIVERLMRLDALTEHDKSAVPSSREAFLRDWYRQPVFASLADHEIASLVTDRQHFVPRRQAELLQSYTVSAQPDYWARISELTVPTLLVAGERDAKYVDIATRFLQRCPQATLSIVPGAGHNVFREQPGPFVERLHRFVEEL